MNDAHRKSRIIIHAGRIFCAASGVDGPGSVIISGEQIESVHVGTGHTTQSPSPGISDDRILQFPDGILLPGLVDLHAHPANSNSVFGVRPDELMLTRGVTTVMSQGDAGAANMDLYVEQTIHESKVRVLLAINLSRIGESTSRGCFENIDDANVNECVAAVTKHREHVRAIAVNTSHHACGTTDPREILRRGILTANETALPILYGMRRPEDWPLDEQLALLRPGDIVTYCFRREPHSIVADGRVLACVKEARQRGILFDVGHGMGSFSFDVAVSAIADGFAPNTISTDLQKGHQGVNPQHDLPLVMSKLRAAGMSSSDIFAAATTTPARILKLDEAFGIDGKFGDLSRGSLANLVVLDSLPNQTLYDVTGQSRPGTLWTPRMVIVAGQTVSM
ncbi:MAG: amidohydrolase family protein [Rhodopirellula sp.]|nr:amidohydrolase family protein [Rhodopirellula sp.]